MGGVVAAIGYVLVAGGAVVETILASTILTALVGNALLSTLSSKLFGPKVPESVGLSGIQVMSRSALEYRKIVYGQAMLSGPIYYNNVQGTNNEYLWYGVALAEGESEDLVSVWFDGDEIPKADIAWTAGTGASDGTGTGNVSTAKWVGESSATAVQIFYYLGDDDQPVCGALDTAFSQIDTNNRLRGVTHLVCKLAYNASTEAVWESGPPQTIKAVIKGRKIYDPRLDTTNGGSGTHRYTDSSTWAWSENPALCVADYLMNIMGVDPATSINWTSIADAADDCEVSVAIPTAATEDRFTCNGVLSLGSSHKDNLDALISSMDGRLSYSTGTWKLRASVWEASSVTITADDLAGPIDVRGSSPKSERFNGVRGFYVDPARNYEAAEFPHVTEATYVTRDNGKTILYDLQLPMTNTPTMAQRLAYRNLGQGNNQVICKLKMNTRGSKLAVGDVVSFTYDELSWTAKTFRCIEWNRNADSTFDVTLREDESTDYDDPIEGAYGIAGTGGVTIPAVVVPPPTSLTATAVTNGVLLSWTDTALNLYDNVEIWASETNVRSNATLIGSVPRSPYTDVISNIQRTRYYWIRAQNAEGNVSSWEPDATTTTAAVFPAIQESPLVADPFIRLGTTYWDEGAGVTYTASAGLNGTDTLRIQQTSTVRNVYAEPRRGPNEWDVQSPGTFAVEVRWRWSLQTDLGGTWTMPAFAVVRVTDENEANPTNYVQSGSTSFSNGDTTGVWKDDSAIIEVADTGTPPRFIQIGIQMGINANAPTFDFDLLDAQIVGQPFAGADKPGLVPDPSTETGKYLKDDGTWDSPAGGSGTIGGSITDNQIAVGATTADDIEGSANLTWNGSTFTANGIVRAGSGNATGLALPLRILTVVIAS